MKRFYKKNRNKKSNLVHSKKVSGKYQKIIMEKYMLLKFLEKHIPYVQCNNLNLVENAADCHLAYDRRENSDFIRSVNHLAAKMKY